MKGKVKWWLLTVTIFSILLAWGKNFGFLTDLFLDYFPGYNKFRTVSMILVIAEFTMPLLGILALKRIINNEIEKKQLFKALKISLGIVGGLLLIFAVLPGIFFNFSAPSDQQYLAQGAKEFVDAIRHDRETLLQKDAFRSLIFVLLSVIAILAYHFKKLNKTSTYIVFALLFIIDLWPIDKRYLNNDSFESKRKQKETFQPTPTDLQILQDKSLDYRVFNASVSTFNDASTSYFHKSIGGYHGAKMRRYQELVDHQISKQNMSVLNMLNTKYFIIPTKEQGPVVQMNPQALGNAWFVKNYKIVDNADAEIEALTNFNPAETAIVDKRFSNDLKDFKASDNSGTIKLEKYEPNYLVYKSSANGKRLAVFSEIYYAKGWNAYIDGKLTQHFRVNYVLRAIIIPKGEHKIEFKFEPKAYSTGNTIELISSILFLLVIAGVLYFEFKSTKNNE
ncbi:MAG: hypothetical protein DRI94_15150 [Bacteroidetes bacterium]|nr:MAG: hypothetical protein DRI94_15150 [Bacteroidota bacterium]